MKKLILIGSALLLSLLPEPVAAPAQQLLTRPTYEIVLSAAPPIGGTVVELGLPDMPGVPVIERQGLERRIGGGR